jgi:hypothetical protein
MELNQLLEGSNNYKSLQADAARLAGKWSKSGLLEGFTNEIEKNNMAMILENQAKQIVSEQSSTGTGASFSAGQGEQWAGVALPLVRKVFAQISAKDFVSVQPMNLPSGLVFYLDFKYGTTAGTGAAGFTNGDNMYGNVSTANSKIGFNVDAAGGLYGAGRFGYSINDFSSSALTWATAPTSTLFTTSSRLTGATLLQAVNFDTVASSSLSAAGNGVIVTLSVTSSALGAGQVDLKAARSISISGSGIVSYYPQFTSTTDAGLITFVVSASAAASIVNTVVTYGVQPNDNSRGDFEDGQPKTGASATISIPEINVQLASEAIIAKTRKLKAQWTPEFAQDLNAYHSIDAEAELTSILSEYISMEIDLELIDMLIQDARTVEYWSAANNQAYSGGVAGTPGTGTIGALTSGYYNTQGQWFQTLGTKVQKVSNAIHQKTLRGGANFLVCSPTVATILESIPGYAADTNGDKMDFAFGVQKVGSLNSRFRVYKNPYMTENTILMGYRGSQFLECGAVYAPYIPLMMTPLVYDPATFTPRKGIMTRYAKKMIRPEFYGKILVNGLDTI